MKRLVLGMVSLAIFIPLLMAASEPTFSNTALKALTASGEGSMSFGHENEGRAWLKFSIQDGDKVSGSLILAAEDHHEDGHVAAMMFPDVVVRLSNFEKFVFKNKSVKFSGPGSLHGDPVRVSVEAYDNEGSKKADRFVIKCTDKKGRVVFSADGYLFRGNIQVGGE